MADAPYTPTLEQHLGFANSAMIASGMPEEEAFRVTERVLAALDRAIAAYVADEVERLAEEIDRACPVHAELAGADTQLGQDRKLRARRCRLRGTRARPCRRTTEGADRWTVS